MLKLKKILLISLASFLNSCVTAPSLAIEQCSILIEEQTCICREYQYQDDLTGPIGTPYEMPFNYCDKLVGYPIDKYPDFVEFTEDIRLKWLNRPNRCR